MFFDDTCKQPENKVLKLQRVANIGAVPIALAEGKTKLRVDFTDDDTEITALILQAIRYMENWCNISIVYQRIELIAEIACEMPLPYGPVIGIESVSDNQAFSGSGPVTYATSTDEWFSDGGNFAPGCFTRRRIVYTAGNFLPVDLKDVCLQVLVFLYENRGKTVDVAELNLVLANGDNYKVKSWV